MPVVNVTPEDLVRLRFAYRPLMEVSLSYQVFINPEFQWPHHRWIEDARRALHDVDLPYFSALIPRRGFIPDFLTPTPRTTGSSIDEDLLELMATPDWLIRKNILMLMEDVPDSEMLHTFLAHPRESIQRLANDIRAYWRRALEEAWPHMVPVLDSDILYRGRLLALDGPDALLSDLHSTICYQANKIQVTTTVDHNHCPAEFNLPGNGIQLVPTIFAGSGRVLQCLPEWHPMIGYSARGVGLYSTVTHASQPLELALGASRAQVLVGLRTPATTSELAHRLCRSSGTISQQLDRLHCAGLVEPWRSGKRVYYRLTPRGEKLLAVFDSSL
jgi:hypothetical protein